jgi:hypothetical protein
VLSFPLLTLCHPCGFHLHYVVHQVLRHTQPLYYNPRLSVATACSAAPLCRKAQQPAEAPHELALWRSLADFIELGGSHYGTATQLIQGTSGDFQVVLRAS